MKASAISARSEFVSDHPLRLAQEIARLLDSDPIAAGQVKEHLSPERLAYLMELPPTETDTVEGAMAYCSVSEEYFEDHFREAILNSLDAEDLVAQLVKRKMKKSEILAALNDL